MIHRLLIAGVIFPSLAIILIFHALNIDIWLDETHVPRALLALPAWSILGSWSIYFVFSASIKSAGPCYAQTQAPYTQNDLNDLLSAANIAFLITIALVMFAGATHLFAPASQIDMLCQGESAQHRSMACTELLLNTSLRNTIVIIFYTAIGVCASILFFLWLMLLIRIKNIKN